MKKIYFVLSYTGTALSKLIKISTSDEFAHVSIALDENLDEMYSFGRLNPYNPFFGGFVHEGINHGTFKRFEKTTYTKIYSLEISDYQYKNLKREIKFMNKFRGKYRFNILGLFLAKFRLKLNRNSCFYCAEFVKFIIDNASIPNNLPECTKPEDFKYMDNVSLIYAGMLRDYKKLEGI